MSSGPVTDAAGDFERLSQQGEPPEVQEFLAGAGALSPADVDPRTEGQAWLQLRDQL